MDTCKLKLPSEEMLNKKKKKLFDSIRCMGSYARISQKCTKETKKYIGKYFDNIEQ